MFIFLCCASAERMETDPIGAQKIKAPSCCENMNWYFDGRPSYETKFTGKRYDSWSILNCWLLPCPNSCLPRGCFCDGEGECVSFPLCCCDSGIPEVVQGTLENKCLIGRSLLCFPLNVLWRICTYPWQSSMNCCDVLYERCCLGHKNTASTQKDVYEIYQLRKVNSSFSPSYCIVIDDVCCNEYEARAARAAEANRFRANIPIICTKPSDTKEELERQAQEDHRRRSSNYQRTGRAEI